MFWAGIIGDELVGLFRVADCIEMTGIAYINFPKFNLMSWYEKRTLVMCRSVIFMYNNAPLHSAKVRKEYLTKIGFQNRRLID